MGRTLADSPDRPGRPAADNLIIACGALVRELQAVMSRNGLVGFDIRAVPASFHNRPERIAPSVDRLIRAAKPRYSRIFVAFADCGTGGALDAVLQNHGVARLPGAHCYAFLSGVEQFDGWSDSDFGAFYLTDFLARHFDSLVWRGLGLDRHPQLRDLYFAHYRKVVYLAQTDNPELMARAQAAAGRLGLAYEHRRVGYGDLERDLIGFANG